MAHIADEDMQIKVTQQIMQQQLAEDYYTEFTKPLLPQDEFFAGAFGSQLSHDTYMLPIYEENLSPAYINRIKELAAFKAKALPGREAEYKFQIVIIPKETNSQIASWGILSENVQTIDEIIPQQQGMRPQLLALKQYAIKKGHKAIGVIAQPGMDEAALREHAAAVLSEGQTGPSRKQEIGFFITSQPLSKFDAQPQGVVCFDALLSFMLNQLNAYKGLPSNIDDEYINFIAQTLPPITAENAAEKFEEIKKMIMKVKESA